MKLLLACLLIFSIQANAVDTLGLYFDPEGLITELHTTEPYQEVELYVVLKDPSVAYVARGGKSVPVGVYFCRMTAPGYAKSIKLTLVK